MTATSRGCAHLRLEALDVFAAMNGAWLVNSAMVMSLRPAFAGTGRSDMSIEEAHRTLGPLLGPASATIFAIALLCSGLSSSDRGNPGRPDDSRGVPEGTFQHLPAAAVDFVAAMIVIAGPGSPPHPGSVPGGTQTLPCRLPWFRCFILCSRHKLMGGFTNGPSSTFWAG